MKVDYAELVRVKDRILTDQMGPLLQAEINVRFAKGMGWWTAEQDGDGVNATMFLEGGGKRTTYLENCTLETMFIPKNITTLALTTKNYSGSIDAIHKLVIDHTHHMSSITMAEDPSGCGCKLIWWPDGLGEDVRTIETSCMHQEIQLALLWCFIEAILKESWFMKLPDAVHTEKELDHA